MTKHTVTATKRTSKPVELESSLTVIKDAAHQRFQITCTNHLTNKITTGLYSLEDFLEKYPWFSQEIEERLREEG
jgi:hypothetical protein